MIFKFTVFAVIALILLVSVTQVIIPAFTGWPFFWYFRKEYRDKRKAEKELKLSKVQRDAIRLEKKNVREKERTIKEFK